MQPTTAPNTHHASRMPHHPLRQNTKKTATKLQHSQPLSWADRIQVSTMKTGVALHQVDHGPLGGKPRIRIADEDLDDCSRWRRCLVGFFAGHKMPFHAAHSVATRAWKGRGLEHISSTDGFLIFRFRTEEEALSVLADGPWLFGSRAIILRQWGDDFRFDRSKISKIPVWIRLHGLHLAFWTTGALSSIASAVGRPLFCDRATYEGSRLGFARICVEVDAASDYVDEIVIDSALPEPLHIRVDYEWRPLQCSICKVFGHQCGVSTAKADLRTSPTFPEISNHENSRQSSVPDHATADPSLVDIVPAYNGPLDDTRAGLAATTAPQNAPSSSTPPSATPLDPGEASTSISAEGAGPVNSPGTCRPRALDDNAQSLPAESPALAHSGDSDTATGSVECASASGEVVSHCVTNMQASPPAGSDPVKVPGGAILTRARVKQRQKAKGGGAPPF